MSKALSAPPVLVDLALSLLTHFGLLLAAFGLAVLAARGLQRLVAIRYAVALAVTALMMLVALVGLNAAFFPKSNVNFVFGTLAFPAPGWACLAGIAFLVLVSLFPLGKRLLAPGLVALVLAAIPLSLVLPYQALGKADSSSRHRNIIIIGIDSLSRDTLLHYETEIPTVASLYRASLAAPGALTPLARTFPAWITTLSGKPPAETGAFFNLTEIGASTKQALISTQLQQQGYQTLFAIDERRFCNIDESYGFDKVLGPKPGVLDFALQGVNDTPLTNLLLQTRLGGHLLKQSYMNTASHVNYDETAILDAIEHSLDGRPLFLAVHFESAHFPFRTRFNERAPKTDNKFLADHLRALQVVDRQVAGLMARLKAHGLLENSLIVLMSDHGESFGEVESVIEGSPEPLVVQGYGHGANVLSEHEHNIVLGFLQFAGGKPVHEPSAISGIVPLQQVKPALEAFAAHGTLSVAPTTACVSLETGIRFAAAADYRTLDQQKLAQEAAGYYTVDQDGRLLIDPARLHELTATKDVAVRCGNILALHRYQDGKTQFLALGETKKLLKSGDVKTRMALDNYAQRLQAAASSVQK
jgi:hypothetical protein